VVKLSVVEIEKTFGAINAVDKVSFELERREFLSLLGPSGCGKTTILRLIAGFERPDAGQILLDGRKLLPVPPEKRQIGFVFQNYALFPHMTVARNIAYGVRFDRRIDTKRRVEELLDLVDLRGFERRRPAELSSGQSQRVALARALAPKPAILLLDEPLSARSPSPIELG
jgi:ABC-type Fe3+/spermidine/putrescine transport system ATPase subunit